MFSVKCLLLCAAAGVLLPLLPAAESVPAAGEFTYGQNRRKAALRLPGNVELALVKIDAGSFMMGSPGNETGRSGDEVRHRVILTRGYWLGKYEVTQEQWQAVMGGNPSRFRGPDLPVEQVSWEDAKKFCNKLNELYAGKMPSGYHFDLPTEAQWEYACRAGTDTALNSGKDLTSGDDACPNLDEVGWYYKNSGKTTHPVGKKLPNRWGLYDMHGNVWEWCRDGYSAYPEGNTPMTDPVGIDSISARVDRGGSWDNEARYCRSALRSRSYSGRRYNSRGFRVALVQDENEQSPAEAGSAAGSAPGTSLPTKSDAKSEAKSDVNNEKFEDGFAIYNKTVSAIPDSSKLEEVKNALADYAAAAIRQKAKFGDKLAVFDKTAAAIPDSQKFEMVKNTLADSAVAAIRRSVTLENASAIFKQTAAAIPDSPKLGDVTTAFVDYAVAAIQGSGEFEGGLTLFRQTAAAISTRPELEDVKAAFVGYAIGKIRLSATIGAGIDVFGKAAAALPGHLELEEMKNTLAALAVEKVRLSAAIDDAVDVFGKVAAALPGHPGLGAVKTALAGYAATKIRGSARFDDGLTVFLKTTAVLPGHPGLGAVKAALADYAAAKIRGSEKFDDGLAVFLKTAAAIPDSPKLKALRDTFGDYAFERIMQCRNSGTALAMWDKAVKVLPNHPKLGKNRSVIAEKWRCTEEKRVAEETGLIRRPR